MPRVSGGIMTIECVYKTPREAATEIRDQYYNLTSGRQLYLIPYNRFDPDNSTFWWLSPSKDNPAYKYGKYAFSICEENYMRIGLYVEKGLGQKTLSIPGKKPDPHMIMDETWFWHDIISEMKTDKFVNALDKISSLSDRPIEFHVEGGASVHDVDAKTKESLRDNLEKFVFQWDSESGKIISLSARHRDNTLGKLEHCSDIKSLSSDLSNLGTQPFSWIDLFIGLRLKLNCKSANSWKNYQIYKNILEPFEFWILS